jgi:sugar-specific transcriptional regulator TrmB
MDALASTLASLGLHETEIAVYLDLLAIGTAPASVLSRRLKIPRSTVQYCGQQLQKKGVVSMIQRGNTNLFSAEDPRRLLKLVQAQKRALEERETQVNAIISDLEQRRHPGAVLPHVRFYEGVSGISSLLDDALAHVRKQEEVRIYLQPLPVGPETEDVHELSRLFEMSRRKAGVRARMIACASPLADGIRAQDRDMLRETRTVDAPDGLDHCEIVILRDMVVSVTVKPMSIFATLVEDSGIAAMQRAMFDQLWDRLDPAPAADGSRARDR